MATPEADGRWIAETVRLYRRYELEVVEAWELCPWAKRVRVEGRLCERVFLGDERDALRASLDAIAEIEGGGVDIALFLYPRIGLDRSSFEQFSASVRTADTARRELGTAPFVFAVFHPDAKPDIAEPERLIPFLRRTPDPTLQLLRSDVLDRVRGTTPQGTQFVDPSMIGELDPTTEASLRERIATANLATALRIGVDAMTRSFEDIARDRAETHARLRERTSTSVSRADGALR